MPDGRAAVYNVYALKKAAVFSGREFAETPNGLEHLIKKDIVRGKGLFFDLAFTKERAEYSMFERLAKAIMLNLKEERFVVWDEGLLLYRAGRIGRQVYTLAKPVLDVEFIGTGMRPTAIKNEVLSELGARVIFGERAPLVIIDGSDTDNGKENVFALNKSNIEAISKQYDVEVLHLSIDVWKSDIKDYASHLSRLYQQALDSGAGLLPEIRATLTHYGVLKDSKVSEEAMFTYLMRNIFFHISGLRNYTVLMGKGDKVVMNTDDDAPAETFVLFYHQRQAIRKERQEKRSMLIKQLFAEASKITGRAITCELEFYQALNEFDGSVHMRELERRFFDYSADENIGFIPQAMGEIQCLDDQYLDKDGLGKQLRLTHQRYQSLMEPLPKYMVTVSDFIYHRPRVEKKDKEFP